MKGSLSITPERLKKITNFSKYEKIEELAKETVILMKALNKNLNELHEMDFSTADNVSEILQNFPILNQTGDLQENYEELDYIYINITREIEEAYEIELTNLESEFGGNN